MSYFDQASLVMIPSGYKTSKVYSIKPTDGSGDMSFSRSNDTATRVNSAGLIEKVRTNVVLRSEEQSNAQYAVIINEIASRVAVANPLTGQNNAYKITSTANNDPYIGQVVTGLSNGENTFSLWLWTDAGQSTEATLFFYNQTASEVYTKAITLTTTPTRFDHTVNFSNIGSNATVRLDLRQTGPTVQYVYTYGWQAESGVATSYIATTSAAVSVGPVANLPRLDYLNSSCPRLLLEPQRTNLITYSEQLNNAAWVTGQSGTGVAPVVTANNAISPDGTQNADTVVFNSGAGTTASDFSTLFQTFGGTTATYTGSFYAKTASGTAQIQVRIDGNNYDKFTITNQWQRFTLTKALTGTGNIFEMVIRRGLNEPMNASATIQLWGVQVELGAYATSYIPTLGAAVTRGADACSKTGISSLIGQTEGTLFVDLSDVNDLDFPEITIDNNNNTDRIVLTRSGAGNWGFFVASSAASTFSAYSSVSSTSGKFALAYSSAGYALYRNGVQIVTGTYNLPTALSAIRFNGRSSSDFFASKCVKQAIIFPTRLSAADLAALTA